MTSAPCPYCQTHAPDFGGPSGTLSVKGQQIPFETGWICGLDTDGTDYHGPILEIRPKDLEQTLAILRKLGWTGEA